jgi:deoxycytidine triphosphate deaminase
MLSGDEIESLGLIDNADPDCFRAASYDVRIGNVIKPDGKINDSYLLPPQGIAEVVSAEIINLPNDISGIAIVKTSLCNEGILLLNIGIVDPGYNGRLSGFLVNFGRNQRILRKNEIFLRLTFQRIEGGLSRSKTISTDDAKYLFDKTINIQEKFGAEFLDITAVTREFTKTLFDEYKVKILSFVAAAAMFLALMTFLLNFGNLILVQRFLQPSDVTRAEIINSHLQDQTALVVDRIKQLEGALKLKDEQLNEAVNRIERLEKKTPSEISH